jgi:hypothetical protein|tara:strand:+ start:185 stop:538 length:354 start_codon:yes stop_codon:yes gene_type:complete
METPQFKSDEEFFAWTFEKISESLKNLAQRMEKVEEGLQKIPPPGPDMIKYKPPLSPVYQNLLELFDTIFGTLNSHEERVPKPEDWEKVYQRALRVEQMEVDLETLRRRLNKLETKQ